MTTPPGPDPEVERYLLLLAAQRSPRTVDAYRRDLADLDAFLGAPASTATTRVARGVGRVDARRRARPDDDRAPDRRRALDFRHQVAPRAPHGQPGRRGRGAAAERASCRARSRRPSPSG